MRYLLPMLLLLLSAGSATADERTQGPREEFFPTAPGTQWVMRWTYADGSDPEEDVIGVVEEKVVNGYHKWRVRVVTRSADDKATTLARLIEALTDPGEDDEVFDSWEYYDVGREAYVSKPVDEEGEPPYTLIHYPVKAGATYTDEYDGITTKVIETGRKVRVPAGTYECIVLEIDYTGGALESVGLFDDEVPADDAPADDEPAFDNTIAVEYWAKGVGHVKTEEYELVDGRRVLRATQELITFRRPRRAD